MKHNIHGPYGNWCLVDGKCSKHFPKDFNEETSFNKNSFVSDALNLIKFIYHECVWKYVR